MFGKKTGGVAAADREALRALMLDAFDDELRQRTEQIREELRQDLEEEWSAEYPSRLAQIAEKERHKAQEEAAQLIADAEADLDERVARQVQVERANIRDTYDNTLVELAQARDQAQQRAEQAEAALQALVEALFPKPERSVAVGRFCRLSTFPLDAVNAVLAPTGQRLRGIESWTKYPVDCGEQSYAALVRGQARPEGPREEALPAATDSPPDSPAPSPHA
jgi:hypothetical protein